MGWEMHERDDSGKWYKARCGIYPLFMPPSTNLTHVFCKEHNQWEWGFTFMLLDERAMDLLAHCRHVLQNEALISDTEFDFLEKRYRQNVRQKQE
jgi:hypothetical protein